MLKCLFFLSAGAALTEATTKWHELNVDVYSFESYLSEFSKNYPDDGEYKRRETLFYDNLHDIVSHNSDTSQTYKKGVNHFTDMSNEEFKLHLGYKKSVAHQLKREKGGNVIGRYGSRANVGRSDVSNLPAAVDWREHGVVTPVKDQGSCGSCWAFASTAMVESYVALSSSPSITSGGEFPALVELSPQQLVSCAPNSGHCGGVGGCEGSIPELAFDYVAENGMTSEWVMPYTSHDGLSCNPFCACPYNQTTMATVTISGHVKLPENDYAAVMNALATVGPLAINVEADTWKSYESGIFPAAGCNQTSTDIDHVVQLVGYGVEDDSATDGAGSGYWTVRNSWTPSWGENGYIRLARDVEGEGHVCAMDATPADGTGCDSGPEEVKVCGTCGVIYDASYPVGAKMLKN